MEYGKNERWEGHKTWIWRSYGLFTALAGVRCYNSEIESFKPRGVPENISLDTLRDYTLYITEEPFDEESCCTRESAERYIKSGSTYWDDRKTRVTHPDWHTPSWLSLNEFKVAYSRFRLYYRQPVLPDLEKFKGNPDGLKKELELTKDKTEPISPIPEVEAIIAYLEVMIKHGYKSRVVFWFDN